MSLIDYIYPEQCGSAKILGQSSKYRGKGTFFSLTAIQSDRPVIDSLQTEALIIRLCSNDFVFV